MQDPTLTGKNPQSCLASDAFFADFPEEISAMRYRDRLYLLVTRKPWTRNGVDQRSRQG